MEETNCIKLTDDSLTNIKLMLPLLNSTAKQRFADMMYGYYISQIYSKNKTEQSYKFPQDDNNKKAK